MGALHMVLLLIVCVVCSTLSQPAGMTLSATRRWRRSTGRYEHANRGSYSTGIMHLVSQKLPPAAGGSYDAGHLAGRAAAGKARAAAQDGQAVSRAGLERGRHHLGCPLTLMGHATHADCNLKRLAPSLTILSWRQWWQSSGRRCTLVYTRASNSQVDVC